MLSGSAQVFEGHPFMVEAGVSLGGKDVKHVRDLPFGKTYKGPTTLFLVDNTLFY